MNTTLTKLSTTTMTYKKSTAGTHVFEDTAVDAQIPTLYIKKTAFEHNAPKAITFTVEFETLNETEG